MTTLLMASNYHYIIMYHQVVLVLVLTGGISAFQPPVPLVKINLQHDTGMRNIPASSIVLSLSNKDEEERQVPFIRRALRKLRKKKDDKSPPNDSALPVEGEAKSDSSGSSDEEVPVDSEAATLKAMANRARLEAEKMDISLTLSKIENLEGKIPEKKEDERIKLLDKTQSLLNKINGVVANAPVKTAVSVIGQTIRKGQTETVKSSKNTNERNEIQDILDGKKPLLTPDKQKEATEAFDELPDVVKQMMARTVGMEDSTNSTAVIEKLMEEKRLYEPDNDSERFSFIASTDEIDDIDIFVDSNFVEINSFVESLLPAVTRKIPVKEEYVDIIYEEVLGMDTFNPRERKPHAIPGGYLIRGESKVKSIEGKDDGDVLIEAIDKKLSKTSVAGKVQVHYILDPIPPSGEEILAGQDEKPVLYITNYDVTPDTQPLVKIGVTFLGMVSIVAFALGSFAFNQDIVDRISATSDLTDLDWLYELSLPLALSVLGIQICHEFGHLIVALKDGINIGLPTFVPSLQFGLTGAITPIKSPPKNMKSLFDFAIAGPLFGILASLILLYVGLEMTAFMDVAGQEQLPSVPTMVLKTSSLGGGIIDYLLGDGALSSPDNAVIKLHPFAIAGFVGLVSNALSLLPLGNTDGGRICLSFFGRSFTRVTQGTTLLILVVTGLCGSDMTNLLLCYAVYCQFFQKENEIPMRNEVDELDPARGLVGILFTLFVLLTLTPLT